MKRIMIVFLILAVVIPAVVFAEVTTKEVKNTDGILTRYFHSNGKEIAKQIQDKDGNVIKTTGKIPNGVVKEYYESGKLKAENNYKDGKLVGTSKFYFESGQLREEMNYKNGKLDGRYRNYYTTGSLGGEWYYKNGKREGVTMLYWENGKTKSERNFKDGKLEGVSTRYYNSGTLRSIEHYKNGRRIKLKAYNKKGEIILN